MPYARVRHVEIMAAHSRQIERYVKDYRPGHPTVVLVPGGLGTRLDRTTQPSTEGERRDFKYHPVWLDVGILFGDAKALAIRDDGADDGEHIIVPNGPLRTLTGRPYDRAARFFSGELGLNYVVFGYDWRRSVDESAGFLEQFLEQLRDRIKAQHDDDPLPQTTLLCHSMGGLVAQRFLQRVLGEALYSTEVDLWMRRLVTVGTPFYGATTHHRRYYAGQPPLNRLYGAENVATLCGHLPGPYALLLLDRATFDACGEALGLDRYPVTDSAGDPADPYDDAQLPRWPRWVKPELLRAARALRAQLARPLPAPVLDRIYHLRAGNDGDTPAALRWQDVLGAEHQATDPVPFDPVPGPGDGTVPRWSARLAAVADSHVYDLPTAKRHEHLMEHDETLAVLAQLITTDHLPATDDPLGAVRTAPTDTTALDDETLDELLAEVAQGTVSRDDPRVQDVALWNRLIDDVGLC